MGEGVNKKKTFSYEKVFVVEHTGFDTYDRYNANVARYRNMRNSAPVNLLKERLIDANKLTGNKYTL